MVAAPAVLDPGVVSGLVAVTDSTNDPADARFVSTYGIPGVPGYQELAQAEVEDVTARYASALQNAEEAASATGQDDQAVNGQLNVTSDVVAAAGQVLAINVSSFSAMTQGVGGGSGTTATAYVTLPTTPASSNADSTSSATGGAPTGGTSGVGATVVTSADLLSADGREQFARAVVDVVAAHPELAEDIPAELSDEDVTALTDDLRLQPDGSIAAVVPADSGLTYPVAGDTTVQIPAGSVAGWLSSAGSAISAQLTSGRPFVGLPVGASASEPAPSSSAPVAADAQVDCTALKCVALTFDDGPGPCTARLLDELQQADVKATFMVVGKNAAASPDLVRAELAAGHEVGNHTWDHKDLTTLTDDQVDQELDRAAAAIAAAGGGAPPVLVRPPYGAMDDAVRSDLTARGQAAVLWNVDTEDWKNRNAAVTTQRALSGTTPGSIVLMHDIHPTTVDAVPGIISALKEEGYTFVTVSQLLGDDLVPGRAYGSGPAPAG